MVDRQVQRRAEMNLLGVGVQRSEADENQNLQNVSVASKSMLGLAPPQSGRNQPGPMHGNLLPGRVAQSVWSQLRDETSRTIVYHIMGTFEGEADWHGDGLQARVEEGYETSREVPRRACHASRATKA